MRTNLYSFETYKNNLLRTIGLGCMVIDQAPILSEWGGCQALILDKIFSNTINKTNAAAKGKVFFVTIDNATNLIENNCFQIKNKKAVNVYCGNSTAATAALIYKILKINIFSFKFNCDNKSLTINCVAKKRDEFISIKQSWELSVGKVLIKEIQIGDRIGYRLDILNDYVFLFGPIDDIDYLVQDKIIKSSLDKKVCLICPNKSFPKAFFYNCNGLHGAAPLTGLVSLAFLISALKPLRKYFNKMQIATPTSIELIPKIEIANQFKHIIKLPDLDVKLYKLFST